jgi:hypothetical protein
MTRELRTPPIPAFSLLVGQHVSMSTGHSDRRQLRSNTELLQDSSDL